MALSILDGTQTATTLSTILSSGQHITAHTVISLGTQAITDMRGAVSGSVVSISNFPSTQTIAGTVTANVGDAISLVGGGYSNFQDLISNNSFSVNGNVDIESINSALPAGTNRIGVVTIGGGTVTIGAGTAQIGSVTASISNFPATQATTFGAVTGSVSVLNFPASQTVTFSAASISGTVPISISSVTVGNSVTIASLPALIAGTAQIGSVTASISGTVPISISSVTVGNSVTIGSLPAISGTVTANLAISSSAITSGSFTSLTSATLVPANTARKIATVYNLGAGRLFINAGATATTLGGGFMVALNSGDFYECDYTTTTLSAIFATAGTASWMSH
jgi:hypothetical protein